ncbi:MAG: hypothetical protein ACXVQQ_00025 [Gaiellaceae bacterium]
MSRTLRLFTAVALAAGAVAATGTAASAPAQPMRVVVVISAHGNAESASPANFAIRSSGTVTVTIRNTTRLFHTFTIRALGISVLVRPLRSASVTFVAPQGVYEWRCVLCSSSAHPHMHAMRGKVYAIVNA